LLPVWRRDRQRPSCGQELIDLMPTLELLPGKYADERDEQHHADCPQRDFNPFDLHGASALSSSMTSKCALAIVLSVRYRTIDFLLAWSGSEAEGHL
jgi:hypothetical protein